jgi:MOSC domain-containing protein YiiM
LYPTRHYARLADEFPQVAASLVPGSIGENLSTDALDEDDVRVGDIWQLGAARLQVSQPRSPCWKIDERYGCDGMAKFIAASGLTGWYWRVLQPGTVAPGDTLDLLEPAVDAPTLREAMQLCAAHRPSVQELERLARVPGIAGRWRDKIVQRIAWLRGEA